MLDGPLHDVIPTLALVITYALCHDTHLANATIILSMPETITLTNVPLRDACVGYMTLSHRCKTFTLADLVSHDAVNDVLRRERTWARVLAKDDAVLMFSEEIVARHDASFMLCLVMLSTGALCIVMKEDVSTQVPISLCTEL